MGTMARAAAALLGAALFVTSRAVPADAIAVVIPDGRSVSPAGFTIPVEYFATRVALSPDGRWLAVLAQGAGAVDVIATASSALAERLAVPDASGMAWTAGGLYVTRGYTGTIARYAYDRDASKRSPVLTKRVDIQIEANGLLNGIAEDPATHRLAVARSADREVVVIDDETGTILERHPASGQPFEVGFSNGTLVATLYDSDHVDLWHGSGGPRMQVATGAHPTCLTIDGATAYVANADGSDVVAVDTARGVVARRFELARAPHDPPGQTPAGMALSSDRRTLFVAESGYNDVAVVDVASGRVLTRIPTAWYPTDLVFVQRATDAAKDPRVKDQLWIASAKGLGSQADPAGEWDGTYTALVQHLVVDAGHFAAWSAQVARNDRFHARPIARTAFPPVKHVVFVVHENKHFDEEFADLPGTNADPSLLLFGRRYTPNAHALAERYTVFDDFMTDGEASIYGHAWTTQGMANDYHERNAHVRDDVPDVSARVAWSIWPYSMSGEDALTPASMDFDWFRDLDALGGAPRVNVSGVFGPRGQLVDELKRKGISFRVYGEQLTMQPDGRIAPGLAANAARSYPGDHDNFMILDTDRAKMFLDDVAHHGLQSYSYVTMPDDHTAGLKPGFYTPASYVANNDEGLGLLVAGLSKRPEWRDTVIFVTCDDAQGTGDHADSHRMPAFAIGPYVRRGFVDHTRYSQTSILRTVELLFGLAPLNVYDAAATPILAAFAKQPSATPYVQLMTKIPMEKNPGVAVTRTLVLDDAGAARVAAEDWASLRGDRRAGHAAVRSLEERYANASVRGR